MARTRASAAGLLGGLAVVLTVGCTKPPAPPAPEKITVLVAKEKIPQGTKITQPEEVFEAREFNKGEEPQGAFAHFEDVKDRRVNRTLLPGTPITADDLMKPGPDGWDKPLGYRSISIKVANHKEVLARLRPGSWVELILGRTEQNETKFEIVAPELELLAVDYPDTSTSVVTLAITPEQTKRIALAAQAGELWVRPVLLADK